MKDLTQEQFINKSNVVYNKEQSYKKIQQYIENGMKGNLDVSNMEIDELPEELTQVGGSLIISQLKGRINPHSLSRVLKTRVSNRITRLPNNLKSIGNELWITNHLFEELGGSLQYIGGNVYMHGNGLRTLVGFPDEINGRFDVTANFLTTLKGGPKVVRGDYNCGQNFITNLDGIPDVVEGNFNCSNTKTLKKIGAIRGKLKNVNEIFAEMTGISEKQIRHAIAYGRYSESFEDENAIMLERYFNQYRSKEII